MSCCRALDGCMPLNLRKFIGIILCVTEVLFFSGIIYGFGAFKSVLKKERIYSHLCSNGNSTAGCQKQKDMYEYAFITCTVVQMFSLILVGFLIDKLGLRAVKLSFSVLFSLGALMFGFTSPSTSWLIFPAACCISVGGVTMLICDTSISNLFTTTATLVISMITGSFDSASVMSTLFASLYDAGYSYKYMFIFVSVVSLGWNWFTGLFILTKKLPDMQKFGEKYKTFSFESESEIEIKSKSEDVGDADNLSLDGAVNRPDEFRHTSTIIRKLHPTLSSSMCSLPYMILIIYFSMGLFRFMFVLSTIANMSKLHFDDENITTILFRRLSYIMAGGLIIGIICGLSIDVLRTSFNKRVSFILRTKQTNEADGTVFWLLLCPHAVIMLVPCVSAALISGLVFVPKIGAYCAVFTLVAFMRGFLFGPIISYIMTAFPIEQFGTLYGVSASIAGAFSCIQYALLQLNVRTANLVACSSVPIMFFLPLYILLKSFFDYRRLRLRN